MMILTHILQGVERDNIKGGILEGGGNWSRKVEEGISFYAGGTGLPNPEAMDWYWSMLGTRPHSRR